MSGSNRDINRRLTGAIRQLGDNEISARAAFNAIKRVVEANKLSLGELYMGVDEPELSRADQIAWDKRRRDFIRFVSWKEFEFACSKKVDVRESSWRSEIATACRVKIGDLQFRQVYGIVPVEWMDQVMRLPDHQYTETKRSNFVECGVGLVNLMMEHASALIAQQLNRFLAAFNGKQVTAAEVTAAKVRQLQETLR